MQRAWPERSTVNENYSRLETQCQSNTRQLPVLFINDCMEIWSNTVLHSVLFYRYPLQDCLSITRHSVVCENKVSRIFTLEQVNLVWTIKDGSFYSLDLIQGGVNILQEDFDC